MVPDSPQAVAAVPDASPSGAPGLSQLFTAFAKMSLAGFGGVLVFARRAIVEEHRWMTADEFNETFALCQFLPGPNIVNLSVVFGARFRGVMGAIAAFTGLVAPPVLIVTGLAVLYGRYGEIPALQRTLAGVSCVAVGLLFSVVLRMIVPVLKRRDVIALVIMAMLFIAVGLLRLPLLTVLLVTCPLSIAVTFVMKRRGSA